ncbi:MAG TPA: MarR family transcriptional regulator [Micromonosporaceae bacterium]|jgi:DNA-binding MarR family transcriptional regulator|nr:MarR family transcriptional regulator [Micromonosporaceae bacterium]
MTRDYADDPRLTAVGLLSEAYLGLHAKLACQIAEHGLSMIEFEILIRLGRTPGGQLRMTDLAAQTSLTASGVTRVVDRLERDSLVTRTACPSDRRSLYTVITQSGRARLEAVLPRHVELIDEWFTGQLTPKALDDLLSGLRTVRDTVRPGAEAGIKNAAALTR